MEWFLKAVKSFSFDGRARRKEYWMFTLITVTISIVLSILDRVLGTVSGSATLGLLGTVFMLAILIQGLAVSARRLHDTGRSGWWLLICVIPFVGAFFLITLMALEGRQGENPYGPDPKAA